MASLSRTDFWLVNAPLEQLEATLKAHVRTEAFEKANPVLTPEELRALREHLIFPEAKPLYRCGVRMHACLAHLDVS